MESEEANIHVEEPTAQEVSNENAEQAPEVALEKSVQDAAAALLGDSDSYTDEEEDKEEIATNESSEGNQVNQQDEPPYEVDNVIDESKDITPEEGTDSKNEKSESSSEEDKTEISEKVSNENIQVINEEELKEDETQQNTERNIEVEENSPQQEQFQNEETSETEQRVLEDKDHDSDSPQSTSKIDETNNQENVQEPEVSPAQEEIQEQQQNETIQNEGGKQDSVFSNGLDNVTSQLLEEENETSKQEDDGQSESPEFSQTEPLVVHEPYVSQSSGESSPRELRSPRQSRTSRSPRPKYVIKDHPDPKYSDDYLDKQIKTMLDTKKLPADQEMYGPMLRYADHQTLELTNAYKYTEAMRYDEASSMLRSFSEDRAEKERLQMEKDKEKQKLDNAQQMIIEINKKWDDQISQKKDEFDKLQKQMEDKHAQEEADYEALWASPEHMAQYSKPSPQLLSLRSIEEKYATAKLFDLAASARKNADQLAVVEANEARLRAVEDMKAGYATMRARQERAEECLKQYFDKEINGMEVKREKELYGWRAMVKRIEQPPQTVRTPREAVLYMPRPLRRKNGQQGTQMLNVGTINLRKFVKTQKPATARASRRSNSGK